MSINNTRYTFGSLTKFFHWTVGIIIIAMLILGLTMTRVSDKSLHLKLFAIHISLGLTVLILIIFRVLWALINQTPRYPDTMPAWEQTAAHLAHYVLYFLILTMPLSGWIMATASGKTPIFWGLFSAPFPGIHKSQYITGICHYIHRYAAYTLIAVLVIHVLSALKHHYLAKDNILKRMLPFYKDKS
jgi:cytochrome b561